MRRPQKANSVALSLYLSLAILLYLSRGGSLNLVSQRQTSFARNANSRLSRVLLIARERDVVVVVVSRSRFMNNYLMEEKCRDAVATGDGSVTERKSETASLTVWLMVRR